MCVCAALGQSKQERGRRIVEEALAALGGERFLAMQDRTERGRAYSFFREELSGLSRATIYTRYLTPPAGRDPGQVHLRERQSFGKEEDRGAVLFTEGQGYQITFRGARPLPAETVNRFREMTVSNIFYILRQRWGEAGQLFEHRGSEIFDNQPAEVVDIVDADNRVVTVLFERSTKLPVRQVFYRRDPKTRERIEEVSIYGKYRDVGDGVQWPFTIQRYRAGEKIFELYSDTVAVNQGLSDNLFLLPADMKILKPLR
ncbi:MAG: hypothetical protein FJW34_03970 [Acidobacteria bacterium]|nr:hypothetical protein [Acidobacteriota bacterium]